MHHATMAITAPPWPAIEALIPHRAPMLLVERIVEVLEEGLVCRGRIPGGGPLADRGFASVFLGLELAAQTAAVGEALGRGPDAGEPRLGYLTSIKNARFQVPELPAERPLLATVRRVGSVPPLAMYSVEVALEDDGSELLTATLGTYLVDTSAETPGVARTQPRATG